MGADAEAVPHVGPDGGPAIAQVALCTTDLPTTARVLVDGLGFRHAGGRPLWGRRLAAIQELPTGDATACTVWWLVGVQEFVQVELFSHTHPPVRPPDRPRTTADGGWAWWGVTVPDPAAAHAALARLGVPTGPWEESAGRSHFSFVEPGSATTVHVDGPPRTGDHLPGGPAVSTVGLVVSDLVLARSWADRLGFVEVAASVLACVAGADGSSVVLDGPVRLVLSQRSPGGRPLDSRALLSEQGLMNVGLGTRDKTTLDAIAAALHEMGASCTTTPPEVAGGVYFRVLDGISLEVLLVPVELEADYGFVPLEPFPPTAVRRAQGPGADCTTEVAT